MQRIAVVDLGTGNLHSVAKALEKVAPVPEFRLLQNTPASVMPLMWFCPGRAP